MVIYLSCTTPAELYYPSWAIPPCSPHLFHLAGHPHLIRLTQSGFYPSLRPNGFPSCKNLSCKILWVDHRDFARDVVTSNTLVPPLMALLLSSAPHTANITHQSRSNTPVLRISSGYYNPVSTPLFHPLILAGASRGFIAMIYQVT